MVEIHTEEWGSPEQMDGVRGADVVNSFGVSHTHPECLHLVHSAGAVIEAGAEAERPAAESAHTV